VDTSQIAVGKYHRNSEENPRNNFRKLWDRRGMNIVYFRSKYTVYDVAMGTRNEEPHNVHNDNKETGQAKGFCIISDKSEPYFGLCLSTFALRILGPSRVPI
jgi:hypothetical protein